MESELVSHFLRFGDLESVAFQPGRSYVFLNFVEEEDAVDAIEELQGFPLAGNSLRIEFAKATMGATSSDGVARGGAVDMALAMGACGKEICSRGRCGVVRWSRSSLDTVAHSPLRW